MVKVIPVSAEELARMQAEFAAQDLASRDENIRLEDVMILRAKGARMVHPKNISFEEDGEG